MTDAPLLTGVGPATDRPMHAGEELKEQKEEKPKQKQDTTRLPTHHPHFI